MGGSRKDDKDDKKKGEKQHPVASKIGKFKPPAKYESFHDILNEKKGGKPKKREESPEPPRRRWWQG